MSVAVRSLEESISERARNCWLAPASTADRIGAVLLATTTRCAALAPEAKCAPAWGEALMGVAFFLPGCICSMVTFFTSILSMRTDQKPRRLLATIALLGTVGPCRPLALTVDRARPKVASNGVS